MPTVFLHPDRQRPADIDNALRTLRKKEENCGILKKLRELEAYEKPTAKRKRKLAAAVSRHKRDQKKIELPKKMF